MADDQTFRSLLMIIFAVMLPYGVYRRVRSQLTGDPLDRRQEGVFILWTLRPLGLAGLAGVVTFLIDPGLMAWSSTPVPTAVRWVGIGLGVAIVPLFLWTLKSLGPNLTDTVVTRKRHELITSGPYWYVRHPFYVAAAGACLAATLATANWFIAVMCTMSMALLVARTPIEERHLARRFGERYVTYQKHTGRFWPRATRTDES